MQLYVHIFWKYVCEIYMQKNNIFSDLNIWRYMNLILFFIQTQIILFT